MNLSEYQKTWNTVLLGGRCTPEQAKRLGIPSESVDLYRGFVRGHRNRVLEKLYPLLKSYVGEEVWKALVEDYYGSYPPTAYELNQLGRKFPDFLSLRDRIWGEIALYEWHEFDVYSAPVERLEIEPSFLAVNPSLVEVSFVHDISEWVRGGCGSSPSPRKNSLGICRTHNQSVSFTYLSSLGKIIIEVLRKGPFEKDEFLSSLEGSLNSRAHGAAVELDGLISQQVILTGSC